MSAPSRGPKAARTSTVAPDTRARSAEPFQRFVNAAIALAEAASEDGDAYRAARARMRAATRAWLAGTAKAGRSSS